MKKLSFHQSKSSEPSKCQRMHVGKQREPCPPLKVHGSLMTNVTEINYLGDCVTSDGKNSRNISRRIQKGTGLLCQIMRIIRTVNFGFHTIEIALLLRESILLNGILTNIEVWHNVTNADIEELEKVDRQFLQKVLAVPKSVPAAALYLETAYIRSS